MYSAGFVDYDVTLLLARYGRRTVLSAIAQKLDLSEAQLESILRNPPKPRTISRLTHKVPSGDRLDAISRAHPEKAHLLQILHERFANRTFLPELRDVKRFLEAHSRPVGAIKSRAGSFDRVLNLLVDLDVDELEGLSQGPPHTGGYSSLALISDAILHRDR